LIRRLGGTIKIGETWMSASPKEFFVSHDDTIGRYVLDQTTAERKVHFGFSVYDLGGGRKRVEEVRRALTRGAAIQKAFLKEHGRTARWVTSREPTLSSVIVQHEKLTPEQNGVEVLVLVGPTQVTLARTLAVQPFEEWGRRDYGRPGRDARSGMLPPKLARVMCNIALEKNSKFQILTSKQIQKSNLDTSSLVIRHSSFTLLDPFCGSGTILTEAMVLGVPQIIGTDVDAKAVADANANVEWVRRMRTDPTSSPKDGEKAVSVVRVHQCDVRALSTCAAPRSVDAIATEPYLGPSRQPTAAGRTLKAELRSLYLDAFREFAKVLKVGGRAVFIVPSFRSGASERTIDIIRDVERLGFRRVNPFPAPLREHSTLKGRADLPYARHDQRVGRQVLVFDRI